MVGFLRRERRTTRGLALEGSGACVSAELAPVWRGRRMGAPHRVGLAKPGGVSWCNASRNLGVTTLLGFRGSSSTCHPLVLVVEGARCCLERSPLRCCFLFVSLVDLL